MGKYIRKSKPAGEVSLMEVSQSYLGVCTRAKTLALKRLQKLPAVETTAEAGGSYLQLRSRRLAKPTIPSVDSKRPKGGSSTNSSHSSEGKLGFMMGEKVEIKENGDLGIDQASFGENILEFEGKERISRESTPISLIRDLESVTTPGSTTKLDNNSTESNQTIQNSTRVYIPTTEELNMFFAEAEQQQHREFINKYNFDPVNEEPLPGRYEWVKLA